MKLRTLLYLLLMAVLNAKAQVPNVAIDAKWNLIFEDEFNGTAVNTSVWKIPFFYFESEDSSCIYDNTIRAYRSENLPNDNVIVDNGILTLTVDSLHTPVTANIHCNYDTLWPSFDTTVTFTTGVLQSIDTFQFGYYEIKFRIPGPGEDGKTFYPFGPNFWLYRGQDINNIESCYSEIDIFEIIDGEMNTYTCNSHNSPLGSDSCGGYPFYTDDGSYYGGGFGKQDISGNTWHFSSVHWTPEKVDYYLDRKLIKTNYKQWAENLDPMQIILDINAPKGGKDAIMLLDNPIIQYPYRYDIDYVRIYQPISNCGTIDKTYCTSTYPSTLDGATVQKSITFGGTGCSASYPDIINSFYANDYILINENTTLGGGSTSELFLEVHSCY